MPNHVHLVLVPSDEDGLRAAVAETHRLYAALVNRREGCRGHLWQERFHSCPLHEDHLLATVRYVELNPVRARLVETADEWRWSSAAAHLLRQSDELIRAELPAALENAGSWAEFLAAGVSLEVTDRLRQHQQTGRPLGDEAFVVALEKLTARSLLPKPAGRPRKVRGDSIAISQALLPLARPVR